MGKVSLSDWSNLEKEYLEQRQKLIEDVDLANYVDDPFVFCQRQKVAEILCRIELFKKVLDIQGSIVECGVYKGNGAMLFCHLSSVLEPYNYNRKVIGFDSFEGLRSLSSGDPKELEESVFSDSSHETIVNMGRISDLNRPIPHIPKLELIKGDATETIPEYVRNHPELVIALLFIDFSIYEPTKVAIEQFLPLVPKGGIVTVIELNSEKWSGGTKAFKECLELNDIRLRKFPSDPWISYFEVE